MPFLNAAKIAYVWTNHDWSNTAIASIVPIGIGASIAFSAQENGALTQYFKQSKKPEWGTGCPCVHAGCSFWSLTPLGYASYRIFKNTAGMMTDKSKVALTLYGSCMALSILSGYVTIRKDYQMDAYTKIGIAGSAIAFALAFRQIDNTAFLCSLPFAGWSIFAGLYHFNLYQLNPKKGNEILPVPKIILPPSEEVSTASEADMYDSFIDESMSLSTTLDVTNHNDEKPEDEEADDMDPETVMTFLTSRVKMHDPVTNASIYPLVSIIDLPESHFEYTSIAKVNNVHRGVLNLMFRQSADLERFLSEFSVDALPISIRKLVRMLQNAPDLKAKQLLNDLDKALSLNPSLKKLATRIQLQILDFLGEYMCEDHYVGELVDNRGRNRSVWRVYNKHGGEEAMITPFASALNKPTPEIRRPFREIVAFSFAPLPAIQSKMKKTVMYGDYSSTCSSSSKLSH